jgi:hypothetical protein
LETFPAHMCDVCGKKNSFCPPWQTLGKIPKNIINPVSYAA